MGSVILLSGPIGAGKTTVARELVAAWDGPLAFIEGDKFWSFIAKTEKSRVESFPVILRAMTLAALPFARGGFDALIDFSIPPGFLEYVRAVRKETAFEYVILRPSESLCAARATSRTEGTIKDYTPYREFYQMFAGAERYTIDDDQADAKTLAARIGAGIKAGAFRVN